jgi:hypothetical protein
LFSNSAFLESDEDGTPIHTTKGLDGRV